MELRKTTMASGTIDRSFWEGKKVLVTGHTGFKGGWLCSWLKTLGCRIVGFSLAAPTKPSLFEMGRIADGMISIIGDIRDQQDVESVVFKYEPEIVFHMAAQALVRYSYMHPVETFSTNVMGTVNILEGARKANSVRCLVVVTSDKCYENREWVWGYRENERMGGRDPYSSSKGCAELVTAAYRESFFRNNTLGEGKAVATVRAGNVIGGGDWAEDRLVPDIVKGIVEGRTVVIRNPHAVRPWQHVLEPVRGYMMLAERLWFGGDKFDGAWNFGPSDDDTRPVKWIVESMKRFWGGESIPRSDQADDLEEAMHLKLDCSKARHLLGWSPKLRLSEGLKWTVEWYQGYRQGNDMRQVTEDQISRYERLK